MNDAIRGDDTDPATKGDLRAMASTLTTGLRGEMAELRTELRSEMAALRTELRDELHGVKVQLEHMVSLFQATGERQSAESGGLNRRIDEHRAETTETERRLSSAVKAHSATLSRHAATLTAHRTGYASIAKAARRASTADADAEAEAAPTKSVAKPRRRGRSK